MPPWMICTQRRQRTRLWWRTATRRRRGRPTSSTRRRRAWSAAAPSPWLLPRPGAACCSCVLVIAWAIDTSVGRGHPQRRSSRASTSAGCTEDELAGRVGDVAADYAATPVELARRRRHLRRPPPARSASWSTRTADRRRRTRGRRRTRSCSRARSTGSRRSFHRRARHRCGSRSNAEQVGHAPSSRSRATAARRPIEPSIELGRRRVQRRARRATASGIDASRRGAPPAERGRGRGGRRRRRHPLDVEPVGPIPPLGSDEAAPQAGRRGRGARPPSRCRSRPAERGRDDRRRASCGLAGSACASNRDGTVGRHPRRRRRSIADLRRAVRRTSSGHPTDASLHPRGRRAGHPPEPARHLLLRRRRRRRAVLDAMHAGSRGRPRSLVEGPAPFTTAEAEALGIKEPVGGNNAWAGRAHQAKSGFTTYHDAGEQPGHEHPPHGRPRARRDHPAGRDVLDQRPRRQAHRREGLRARRRHRQRRARPRRSAAACRQFATTLFNAAFFAGLALRRVPGPLGVLRPLPAGPRGDDGLPGPRPRSSRTTRRTGS